MFFQGAQKHDGGAHSVIYHAFAIGHLKFALTVIITNRVVYIIGHPFLPHGRRLPGFEGSVTLHDKVEWMLSSEVES